MASIHAENGKWRVKYRVNRRQRSRSFDRKGDAKIFAAEVTRRTQLGPLLVAELDRSAETLGEFVRGSWLDHAATLSKPTRRNYRWALENHLPELRDEPLVGLGVPTLSAHQRRMIERGATPSTVREVMACLSGILQVAVEQGKVPGNAARSLRKVKADPRQEAVPLSPVELECLIAYATGRNRIIFLLAGHLGLRPKEVRLVPWSALQDDTLLIGQSQTKRSAMRSRTIAVPRATAIELGEWRLRSGRPDDIEPIIGGASQNAVKLWSRRNLRAAIATATEGRIPRGTLYTLRHSHASALHYCGFTVPEAARRLGHDAGLHLKTYAHCIDSIGGERFADLDHLIEHARGSVPSAFREDGRAGQSELGSAHKNPPFPADPSEAL